METKYTILDETKYEKTTPQQDLIETKTLDDLLVQKESLEKGIANNNEAIIFQQAKLDEVLAEIETVKALGIKTQAEVTQVLEDTKIINEEVTP